MCAVVTLNHLAKHTACITCVHVNIQDARPVFCHLLPGVSERPDPFHHLTGILTAVRRSRVRYSQGEERDLWPAEH